MVNLTLGDISEADDRVKKFFRILPKDNIKEIKTVRMVKRDSKERSISKTGNWIEDEDVEQVMLSAFTFTLVLLKIILSIVSFSVKNRFWKMIPHRHHCPGEVFKTYMTF